MLARRPREQQRRAGVPTLEPAAAAGLGGRLGGGGGGRREDGWDEEDGRRTSGSGDQRWPRQQQRQAGALTLELATEVGLGGRLGRGGGRGGV